MISIVTVNYNNLKGLIATVESVLMQTFEDYEFIVVDGASNDGGQEYLESVKDHLDLLISEPDNGIYDAMNKGIQLAKGEWTIFLNSGDYLVGEECLVLVDEALKTNQVDMLYGNSIKVHLDGREELIMPLGIENLKYTPIFRHNCLFARTSLLKAHPFSLSSWIGTAADYHFILKMYNLGGTFYHFDRTLIKYESGGVSDSRLKNLIDNYKLHVISLKWADQNHHYFLSRIFRHIVHFQMVPELKRIRDQFISRSN